MISRNLTLPSRCVVHAFLLAMVLSVAAQAQKVHVAVPDKNIDFSEV